MTARPNPGHDRNGTAPHVLALPASCGCSCHPPVVGDDGIPHHAEMTAGGMNRCLPGCPATSGHRGVPGGAA